MDQRRDSASRNENEPLMCDSRNKGRIILYAIAVLTMLLWIPLSKYGSLNIINLFLVIPTVSILIAFLYPPRPLQIFVATMALHILNVCFFNFRDSLGDYNESGGWSYLLVTILGNAAIVGLVSWGMRTRVVKAKGLIFYATAMLTMLIWITLTRGELNSLNLFLVIPAASILIAFFFPPRPRQIVVATVALHALNVCLINFRDAYGAYYDSGGWSWLLARILGNAAVVGILSWAMRTIVVGAKALWWGRVLRAMGGILFTLGLLGLLVWSVESIEMRIEQQAQELDELLGVLLLLSVLLVLGSCIGYRGRQYDALARRSSLEKDDRRRLLYLRSFRRDESIVRLAFSSLRYLLNPVWWQVSSWGRGSEDLLADALAPLGPLVAVGKPGERLPKPGAPRVYMSDEEWKSNVVKMMKKAQLVIVRLESTGEGLWWEIEQASKIVAPGRLVILSLLSKGQYSEAQEHIQEITGLKLPDLETTRTLILPARGGRSVVLKLEAPYWRTPIFRPLGTQVRCALRPVFKALNCEWTPPPVSATRVIHVVFWAIFVALILAMVVVLFFILGQNRDAPNPVRH